jgi:insulysin
LTFSFPVPAIDPYYDRQPLSYLASLIGHEGEGSLHQILREQGWIESLVASPQRSDQNNAMLSVRFRLTEQGRAHQDDIKAALFAYIELIEQYGIEAWRYEEQAAIAQLEFDFQEKVNPSAYAYRLSPNLRLYPPEDLLQAPYLMRAYDETLIRRFLGYLRPDNLVIERAGPDIEGDRTEPWFNVSYAVEPLELPGDRPALAARSGLAEQLTLPDPNPFLPESLAMLDPQDEQPWLLVSEPGMDLWLARDPSFGAPRASTFIELALHDGLSTRTDQVHARLLSRLVQQELNAYAYPAELAGLRYDISTTTAGLQIRLSGFSDKQPLLARDILRVLAEFEPDADTLALHRDEQIRHWRNFRTERVFQQTFSGVGHLLVSTTWHPDELADRMAQVDVDSLRAWMLQKLGAVRVTAMLHGNFSEEDALEMAETLRNGLPLRALERAQPDVMSLAERGALRMRVDVDQDDAAYVLYFQAPDDTLRSRGLMGLTAQMLRNPYFTDLRTEQQLGYAVITTPTVLHRRGGVSFIVQSPVAGPAELHEATVNFLHAYRDRLAEMTPSEFESHKQGLITQLLQQDQNLAERSQRFWRDLDLGFIGFDSQAQIAQLIGGVGLSEYLTFYDSLLRQLDGDRLVIYSPGQFQGTPPGADLER